MESNFLPVFFYKLEDLNQWDNIVGFFTSYSVGFKGWKHADKGFFLLNGCECDGSVKIQLDNSLKGIGLFPDTLETQSTLSVSPTIVYESKNVRNLINEIMKEHLRKSRPHLKVDACEIRPEDRQLCAEPNFFEKIAAELKKKIVGEVETSKTILLIAIGASLCDNASPESGNLLINDESGAGKDHVTRHALAILPQDKVIKRSRITETAFTYWHTFEKEPEWTWTEKIFYLEDVSEPVLNCDVVKVLSSNKEEIAYSSIVINQKCVQIGVRGKPVMLMTTFKASPQKETLRRYPILNLDISKEQTRAIKMRIAELAMKGQTADYNPQITKCIALLKRHKVKIPFAEKLMDALSDENVIVRTHFSRFLDYIKFSTVIHQCSRQMDDEGYLLADRQDYDIARLALIATTSNVLSIPLTRNQKTILKAISDLKISDKIERLAVSDIEPKVPMSEQWLRKELDKLTEWGFLNKDKQERTGSTKPVMTYDLNNISKLELKTGDELDI